MRHRIGTDDMLKFEPFSLFALQKALPYIKNNPSLCSDLSAGYLYMWHEGADLQLCVWRDTFVVRQIIGEQNAFSYPIGRDQISAEMDDDTSWAAGIAQFGMLMRDSSFAGTSDLGSIRDRLKKDPRIMSDDFRAEFLYMLDMVEENMENK